MNGVADRGPGDSPGGGSRARIRRLAPELADQIAAGEVIERPASVVKELVENSLDAGAQAVEIHVEGGGSRLLRVSDDGHGIAAGELALALQRHATSKLDAAHGLFDIRTLGFRGEALPSIASVSRLRLLSRISEQEPTWGVRAEGGRIGAVEPASGAQGTMVEVRDLFYNLPARRKFLRTGRTEQLHIIEWVRHLALGYPATAFSLHLGRQSALRLPAVREARDRLDRLLGRSFLEQALAVRDEHAGLRLEGWVCLPSGARPQPDRQYFFLNGRPLRDRTIQRALRTVYAELLGVGRHPCYVLYLRLDSGLVDVNVHPAKHEVRFREPRTVHDFIVGALRRLTAPSGELFSASGTGFGAGFAPGPERPDAHQVREILRGYEALTDTQADTQADTNGDTQGTAPVSVESAALSAASTHERPGAGVALNAAGTVPGYVSDHGALEILGLVAGGRYLLATDEESLLLVDYPAARRLLCLEHLRRAHAAGPLHAQPLLLPLSLAAGTTQLRYIEEWHEPLRHCGLSLRESGPGSLLLRELPAVLHGVPAALIGAAVLAALELHGSEREPARRSAVLLEALAAAQASAPAEAAGFGQLLGKLLEEPGVHPGATERSSGRRDIWSRCGARELARLLKA